MSAPGRVLPALALLALAPACRGPLTDPEAYREAARRLEFRIVHVEPNLELALPPAQPRIRIGIVLGVDNPTDVPFQARHLRATLVMDGPSGGERLGEITLEEGLDIRPHGPSEVKATVTLGPSALRGIGDLVARAVTHRTFDGLRLEGEARIRAHGFTWTVPVRARVLRRIP